MPTRKNVDWVQLETEYVTTGISYAALSAKYGVSKAMICNVGKARKWVEAREKYRHKVAKKAIGKIGEKQAQHLAKVMKATNNAAEIISDALDNKEQFYTYLTEKTEMYGGEGAPSERTGIDAPVTMRKWSEEQRFSKLDTKALREATQSLKEITTMLRDFYDIPTATQAENREIAKQRLELERRKLEAAIRDDDEENETGIILMPPRKDDETKHK